MMPTIEILPVLFAIPAEKMTVILRDGADAGQSSELAGLLITIYGRRFEITDGHIPVRELLGREDLHVVRAVHGFHAEMFL